MCFPPTSHPQPDPSGLKVGLKKERERRFLKEIQMLSPSK